MNGLNYLLSVYILFKKNIQISHKGRLIHVALSIRH